MKGDFTRSTFDSRKHYSSVRMQQGRVQIDADWNEQMDIFGHRVETETVDVIGRCGFPKHAPGFEIKELAGDLLIGPGRGYVDGILCELEAGPEVVITKFTNGNKTLEVASEALEGVKLAEEDWVEVYGDTKGPEYHRVAKVEKTTIELASAVSITTGDHPRLRRVAALTKQPHLPKGKGLEGLSAGTYFAYLDVWRRHVTAVEDPAIRETALGGPDTATRAQTVWQVKLAKMGGPDTDLACESELNAAEIAPPTGKLRARTRPVENEENPCIVPASSGYTLLENQLYRVEVHKGGSLNTATFKWSRDNGSIATEWLSQTGDKLTVQSTGRDSVLRFEKGGWLELTNDERELWSLPGEMRQIKDIEGDVIEILPANSVNINDFPSVRKARRWDSAGALPIKQAAGNDGYLPLEGGIEIRFEPGTYRTGDYWLIPARAFIGEHSGQIEWPQDGTMPLALPPHGIDHHYCKLGIVKFDGKDTFEVLSDCRDIFPPLTELEGGCCCCTIEVGDGRESHGDFDDLALAVKALKGIKEGIPVVICLLPGTHKLKSTVVIDRDDVTVRGCGRLSVVIGPEDKPVFAVQGTGVRLENLCVTAASGMPAILSDGAEDLQIIGNQLENEESSEQEQHAESGLIVLEVGTTRARIVGNQLTKGDSHGIALAVGPHGDIVIAGNEISYMKGCGIASINSNISEEGQLRRIVSRVREFASRTRRRETLHEVPGVETLSDRREDLQIEHNTIEHCVSPPAQTQNSDLPFGGIVLRRVAHLQITDNRIQDNGTSETRVPVAGICVQDCKGLIIHDNLILENGPPPEDKTRVPGLQGGILAFGLSVEVEEVDIAVGDEVRQARAQPDGWPAASIQNNLVVAPRGLALFLMGIGPMQVTGNRLTSRDVLGSGPSLEELKSLLAEEQPLASPVFLNALLSFFGSVVIFNIGWPARGIMKFFKPSFSARTVATHYLANRPVVDNIEVALPASTEADDRDSLAVGGKVDFSNNQIALDLRRGAVDWAIAAVGILTLDDLALHDNQTECSINIDFVPVDTLAIATTLRATGNGFNETFWLSADPPSGCWISFLGLGLLQCSVTSNQGTHCILPFALNSANLVNWGNLSLFCPRSLGKSLLSLLSFLQGEEGSAATGAEPATGTRKIAQNFEEMLGTAEATRRHSLLQFAELEDKEAQGALLVREELARELGTDHPQIRALDRRLAGARRFVDITRKAARETVTRPETEVVGDWVVKGRVLDAGEKPVAGARITLKSEDQDLVQRFGEIRTGEDGRYEKSFSGKDLAAVFKRASKARLVVTSPDGKLTTTTTELQPEADKIHAFDLRLKSPKKKG